MRVLALDLATVTGWAARIDDQDTSGFVDFTPHPGEGRGWRYIRFNAWLYPWKQWNLEAVVAAYNAGQGGVEAVMSKGGLPRYAAYPGYVVKVMTAYAWYLSQL